MLVGIFGAGRNGSSLLMRLLDGSPGLWIYPIELNYLRSFAATFRSRALSSGWPARHNLPPRSGGWDISLEQRQRQLFRSWAGPTSLMNYKETYLDKLVKAYFSPNGTPLERIMARITSDAKDDLESYLDAIPPLLRPTKLPADAAADVQVDRSLGSFPLPKVMFPGMKCIHIMRHPYSNYSSLKRTDMVLKRKTLLVSGRRHSPVAIGVPLDSTNAEFTLQGLTTDPTRHYLVRYEDICDSPTRTVTDICSWLGVAPPEEPTVQTVLGGRRTKSLPIRPS